MAQIVINGRYNSDCNYHAQFVKEEFRLASVFVRKFPRKFSAARAATFGEEHKHFTAQRAMRQVRNYRYFCTRIQAFARRSLSRHKVDINTCGE